MSGKITDNLGRSSGLVKAVEAGGGTSWQGVKTSGFTAVAGEGYPCNTTSSAFTATLPSSPSVGDMIEFIDYGQTFATNNLTIDPDGNKFNGLDDINHLCQQNRMSVSLVYVDATKGWCPNASSNAESSNSGNFTLATTPYTADFLVIGAGGAPNGSHGAGAGGAGGFLNSYGSEASGGGGASLTSLSLAPGIVYTATIGAGGASGSNNGGDTTFAGAGITTLTALGGGYAANDGGSGGGGIGHSGGLSGGSGTANQGHDGGDGHSGGYRSGGGGGGAGAAGQNGPSSGPSGNGGAGVASEITGASVTRGGGGCGGAQSTGRSAGSATGGGGSCSAGGSGGAGTANTGGGGGGGDHGGGTGGSGVVILRMPTANYSTVITGSPTVATDGSDTVVTFTGTGTIRG